MAYNPAIYSPYAPQAIVPPQPIVPMQPMAQQPQPSNGLVFIDGIEGAQMYPQAPDSVSQPLFLKSEDAFIVKTTDAGGAASLKKYSFTEIPLNDKNESELYVTKDYFDSQITELKETINDQRTASEQPSSIEQ